MHWTDDDVVCLVPIVHGEPDHSMRTVVPAGDDGLRLGRGQSGLADMAAVAATDRLAALPLPDF